MDIANLVGVHETGVTHHVAAVGEIDGEHRTSAVANRGATVIVKPRLGWEISSGKEPFHACQKRGIDGEHVGESPVVGTAFLYDDSSISLENLSLDLTHMVVDEGAVILLPRQNAFAGI